MPNFPLYTGLLVAALGGAMVLAGRKRDSASSGARTPLQRPAALICALVLLGYGLVLAGELLPYTVATTAMVCAVGGVIAGWRRRQLPILIELALLTGLGTEVLFTEVFRLALP